MQNRRDGMPCIFLVSQVATGQFGFKTESEAELIRGKFDQFITKILKRRAISEQAQPEWKCLRRSESLPARGIRRHDQN